MKTSTTTALTAAALFGIFGGGTASAVDGSTRSTSVQDGFTESINGQLQVGTRIERNNEQSDKHDCKGKNDCRGQGGCSASDNGCRGKNSCKGRGGCNAGRENK